MRKRFERACKRRRRKIRFKNAFKYKADGRVVTKSYIDLKNDVDALGTALYELDLNGASIAIIGENRYEWGTAYFSVINGLGRGIPLDKHLPAAEIVNLIKRSKAEAIFFSKRYLSVMKELSETDAGLKIFICFDDYTEAECFKGLYRMSGLIERGRELLKNGNDDFISLKIDREAPCILLFTSGTTSASKGVLLCHRNIAANVTSISGFIDVKPDDVALSVLPLHHTFENTAGMMFMIHSGVCIAYCEGIRHIAANLREFDITWMIGVPAIFEAILKQINDGIKKSGAEKKVKFLSGFANFLLKLGIDARSTVMQSSTQ